MTKKEIIQKIKDTLKAQEGRQVCIEDIIKVRNGRQGMHAYILTCYNGELMFSPWYWANERFFWSANLMRLTKQNLTCLLGRVCK